MKTIPLTRGLVALVDDADHEHLSRWRWSARAYDAAARTHFGDFASPNFTQETR